jgi:hypothetical protein
VKQTEKFELVQKLARQTRVSSSIFPVSDSDGRDSLVNFAGTGLRAAARAARAIP